MEAQGLKERALLMEVDKPTKRMKISPNHQMTIPTEFYEKAGFTDEAIVQFDPIGRRLIVKPAIQNPGFDFSEDILRDLIKKGLQGEELLHAFQKAKQEVPNAMKHLLADEQEMAHKAPQKPEDMSLDDFLDSLPDDEEPSGKNVK